ncbi:hypothetical protein [Seonamhaeicola sp.]|uniref:hypothetical protein n=1 Tax=Seonamhaeicola sp. TaxID=1912245 RepID=UPI0026212CCB|nr:hypothetical protein [Seonamhaeicola sp.]
MYILLYLDGFLCNKAFGTFGKFCICCLVTGLFTVGLRAQEDSLKVERLYRSGFEYLRKKPKIALLNFERAVRIINDSMPVDKKEGRYFLMRKALMLDELSYAYRRDFDFALSLKAIQESLEIKESLGETYTLPKTYRMFGLLYFKKQDSAASGKYLEKALELSKTYKNDEEYVYTLNALSGYSFSYDDLESGRTYAQKAYVHADSVGFDRGKAGALTYLSGYERRKERYEAVVPYSEDALVLYQKEGDSIGIEKCFKQIGYAYRKLGQPLKAKQYYIKSLQMAKDMEIEGLWANRYLSLSNVYTDLQQCDTAFGYYRLYKRQQVKDLNAKSNKEFFELEATYQYDKQIEQASSRFWKITSVFLALFGIIIIAIISVLFKRKEQIKIEKLHNDLLQREVDHKQKDISEFALNLARNRERTEELLNYIKKIKKSGVLNNDANFRDLEQAVLKQEITNKHITDFRNKADALNTAFYKRLHDRFPNLSKNEVKLCTYIRLGIDNNEIAILQNVAPASIYRSRSRLRQKLGLSQDEDLNLILKDI